MKFKDTMNDRMFIRVWKLTRKPCSLQRVAYYNNGFLRDAENFNLVENETMDPNNFKKNSFLIIAFDIIGNIFYRYYLIVFFVLYFLGWSLGFILKRVHKLSLRLIKIPLEIQTLNSIKSEKLF